MQQNVAEKTGEIQKLKKERDSSNQRIIQLETDLKQQTEDASARKAEIMKIKMGQKLTNNALEDELKRQV